MKKRKSIFNSNLHLKLAIVYLIFIFLSVFTTALMLSGFVYDRLEEYKAVDLYKSANVTATEYLPQYFDNEISFKDVQLQLSGLSSYTQAAVWFVDKDGVLICSSTPEGYSSAPHEITDFDPMEGSGSTFIEGHYHDTFSNTVLTVMAPVVYNYHTQGYLLVHKDTSAIVAVHQLIMMRIYITLAIIIALSMIILVSFDVLIYLPLRMITEAATQYASGNLDYEIPVRTQDEMGYLSASLNYMSSQLQDMEDYQKKFVANVSHDFRSPLTSIKGYVEAMADGTIPPELQPKYLGIILYETERLTDLTRDLLELNEFDTKNLLLNKEDFDIQEVIRDVLATFEGVCTQKRLSIELVFEGKSLGVHADKRKIQRVLYNLIDNAIKFSNPDSSLTIETTIRGEKVLTSVKDYGIGIPRDALNKIWERFYKSDLSRGKDKKGTGLGLSIVKETIQAHGENINVISTEGVGTEFTFSLPRVDLS